MRASPCLERRELTAPGENRLQVPAGLDACLAGPALKLARIQPAAALPDILEPIADGARVSAPWRFGPFESHLPGPDDHVLVTTLSAEGTATWTTRVQTLHASLAPGAFTLVPRGHDGHWRVTGAGTYRGVFLGPARLQRCAEELGRGREPELSERLQAPDPTMFNIMRMIGKAV